MNLALVILFGQLAEAAEANIYKLANAQYSIFLNRANIARSQQQYYTMQVYNNAANRLNGLKQSYLYGSEKLYMITVKYNRGVQAKNWKNL